MKSIRKYAPEILVYVDEAGIDKLNDYPYGYCHKYQRYMAENLGHKTEILSTLCAWREGEIIARCLMFIVIVNYSVNGLSHA